MRLYDAYFGAESEVTAKRHWDAAHEAEDRTRALVMSVDLDLGNATMAEDARTKWYLAAMFLADWAEHGYSRVTTSHSLAAALMCTDVSREDLSDVRLPWPAFEIRVPDGLLKVGIHDYSVMRVWRDPTGKIEIMLFTRDCDVSGPPSSVSCTQPTIANMFGDDGSTDLEGHPLGRVWFVARRFAAGLLLLMHERRNFVERMVSRTRRGRTVSGPPEHRLAVVGVPVEHNLTQVVRGYVQTKSERGKVSPPTVVSLVSGHWRRQPCGPGLTARKVIYVEPYWKGPRDAAILVRERTFADDERRPD